MTATLSVTRSLVIRATPERVWEKLTDEASIAQWLTEFRFTAFEPGARFTMPDGDDSPPGVLVTIEPPHRFAFRWTAEKGHDAMTLVSFTLGPVAEGTLVTVTESEFEKLDPAIGQAPFERNSKGWGFALAGLANLVEGKSDVSGDGTDN
jgi:uncharacterized protein YndB with AHSA1/START domain